MDVSVIIPAYNEAQRILNTLEQIEQYRRQTQLPMELIVVDDGSSDNTATLVAQHYPQIQLVRQQPNQGKFAAFCAGVAVAQHDWVLLYDADGATPIGMLDQFLPLTDQYDCLVGSRRTAQAHITVPQSLVRTVLGRLAYYTIRLVTGLRFKDTQCGFKLCRTALAKRAANKMIIRRFAGDVEFLYLVILYGGRSQEVPVEWHDVPHGQVHGADYWHSFLDVLKIRRAIKRGQYH